MDDLVLNISFDEPVAKKRSNLSNNSHDKTPKKRKAPDNPIQGASNQPKKRRKLEEGTSTHVQAASAAVKAPRHIVSSLFTSNPLVPKASTSLPIYTTPALPSNAPLTDSSTFEGVGLHKLLINHLQGKMNIQKPTSIQRAALPHLLRPYDDKSPPPDIFLQSQTGSGKTLAFLLPIIQDLLPLSSLSYIDRSIGTLAIIIAPTRELAKQISDVLETLLKMRLRESQEISDDTEPRLTRWLVSGLLSGGATRAHEKARLRKGLPILVATPGRLLDHLQNSTSFNVGKCRWLVLDEADRLMDLGFEETIQGILKGLDGRRKLAMKAVEQGQGMEVGGWEWRERRTILCSATIREDVQKLAGTALKRPIVIRGSLDDPNDTQPVQAQSQAEHFAPPSQLSQKYIVTPLKLRLVTLVALLRSLLADGARRRDPTRIIVFLSSTDSVDFHWSLLGKATMGGEDTDKGPSEPDQVSVQSSLLPDAIVYRLHGSLPLATRLASVSGFAGKKNKSSKSNIAEAQSSTILLCTSVASRGLDLPQVRAVIQYDLPTEGGATEYIHRVGRTARAGKGGEAWSFVCPSEAEWVPWLEERLSTSSAEDTPTAKLHAVDNAVVLRKGFGGKGTEYEERATEVQLAFERWVLASKENAELARSGFKSHLRAYATHPADEKHIFHVRNLHSGHLAKAFALRDAPSGMDKASKAAAKVGSKAGKKKHAGRQPAGALDSSDEDADISLTEKRMKAIVREQGRLTKKKGMLMPSGVGEFQIASSDTLAKLVKSVSID